MWTFHHLYHHHRQRSHHHHIPPVLQMSITHSHRHRLFVHRVPGALVVLNILRVWLAEIFISCDSRFERCSVTRRDEYVAVATSASICLGVLVVMNSTGYSFFVTLSPCLLVRFDTKSGYFEILMSRKSSAPSMCISSKGI